jgi:hypothetical protein
MRSVFIFLNLPLLLACPPPPGGNDGGNDAGVDAGCVPSCGSRACGTETTCGTSCGACAQGSVCSMAGQCVMPEPFLLTTGGGQADTAFGLTTDKAGNTYVSGYFSNSVTFGNDMLVSMAKKDVFISKINIDGEYTWTKAIKGTGTKQAQSMAVDEAGAVFVSGFFEGQATFGTKMVTSTGNRDLFVTKLSAAGDFEWTFTAGGAGSEMAGRVAVSPTGAIYVAGDYSRTVTIGTFMLTSVAQSADVMVIRLNADGVPTWAVSAGGDGPDEARGVAVTSGDGVAIGGVFSSTAIFGSQMLSTLGFAGSFAAKLDAQGAFLWATGCNSTSTLRTAFGWAMAMDTDQSIYVAGQVNGQVACGAQMIQSNGTTEDAFVVKFTPTGAVDWAKTAGGTGTDIAWTVAVDGNGNGLLGGEFEGTASFGTQIVTAKGVSDALVARFDSSGNFTQVYSAGGATAVNTTFGVAWLPWGKPVVVGGFEKTTTFGSTMRASSGLTDVFVWAP